MFWFWLELVYDDDTDCEFMSELRVNDATFELFFFLSFYLSGRAQTEILLRPARTERGRSCRGSFFFFFFGEEIHSERRGRKKGMNE